MNIRKAKMSDTEAIYNLNKMYADEGLMLPRPLNLIYENLRDFTVVEEDGQIVATAALHILWNDMAEIRAMAVDRKHQGRGIGKKLVEIFVAEARELEIATLFALTYQPGFFKKCGFEVVPKESLPHKVWRECINCSKFPNCEEVAMIRYLTDERRTHSLWEA